MVRRPESDFGPLGEEEATVDDAQLSADADAGRLEVDVGPLETAALSPPSAGHGGEPVEGGELVRDRGL